MKKPFVGPVFPTHTRIWVLYAGSWVKIKLTDEKYLSFGYTEPTEEGYHSASFCFWLREGVIYRAISTNSCDCDGPFDTFREDVSRVGDTFHGGLKFPRWVKVSSRQRDYYAEAMGY